MANASYAQQAELMTDRLTGLTVETSLLRMLLEEEPIEAFYGLVEKARKEGVSAERIDALEDDVVLALQLRSYREDQKRREQELGALYETALDLTAKRHVKDALRAIVRRARQLLHSDVAYLTLNDSVRGQTFMRVSEGTVSTSFGDIRLAFGAGLGGTVAETGRPVHTSDYLADSRFAHSEVVDEVVKEEGLVAILGVPLALSGEVIGVLFAAQRSNRYFKPEEVHLLSSLAAHAAVALDNVRLFEEKEHAIAGLQQANAAMQAHGRYVERAAAAHERLTALAAQGASLGEIAEAVGGFLDGWLTILDDDLRPVAAGGSREVLPTLPAGDLLIDAGGRELLSGYVQKPYNAGRAYGFSLEDRPGWVAPIIAGGSPFGSLLFLRDTDLTELEQRTLERAAQLTALLMLNQSTIAEAERRLRAELLEDLLSEENIPVEQLVRRAGMASLEPGARYAVLVVAVGAMERHHIARLAAEFARERGGLASVRDGQLVLAAPDSAPRRIASEVVERLADHVSEPITVGAAGPVEGLLGLSGAYRDAVRCARTMLALGREGEVGTPEDLGFYRLLLDTARREDITAFVESTLGPVLRYDIDRGTDLVATLGAYLGAGLSVARAARSLHIHPNTLYKRLGRISALLGEGWEEGDRALEIQLALRLRVLHG